MENRQRLGINIDTSMMDSMMNDFAEISKKKIQGLWKMSMRAAVTANVIKSAKKTLKSKLKDSTGLTAKSLGVKTAKKKAMIMIGGMVSDKKSGQLIHILDSGTSERNTKNGYNRGSITEMNFINEAYKTTEGQLISTFDENFEMNYQKYVIREVKKRMKN